MRTQADEAKAFHRAIAAARPGAVSARDVWWGNRRAEVNALLRRAVYLWFRRRMRG